jgi:hypothetical protein
MGMIGLGGGGLSVLFELGASSGMFIRKHWRIEHWDDAWPGLYLRLIRIKELRP